MLQPIAKAEAIDATARMLSAEGKDALLLTADVKGDAKALAFQNKMVADLKTDTGLEAMTTHAFIFRNEKFLNGEGSAEAFRSEEHTSELQSLMRTPYAVFCLEKKKK